MKKDPLIKKIKEISKKSKKWIMIGSLPIRDGKKLRNRSLLIGPRGKIVKYYDKINMFDVKISKKRNLALNNFIQIKGAKGNNLKNINIKFPLNNFICITGVSGGGKSSLIIETLYTYLADN